MIDRVTCVRGLVIPNSLELGARNVISKTIKWEKIQRTSGMVFIDFGIKQIENIRIQDKSESLHLKYESVTHHITCK